MPDDTVSAVAAQDDDGPQHRASRHTSQATRNLNGHANGRPRRRRSQQPGGKKHGRKGANGSAQSPAGGSDSSPEAFLFRTGTSLGCSPAKRGDRKRTRPTDDCSDDWYDSGVYEMIARHGSDELPGNRKIAVQRWLLHFFHDIERAFVFAQLLYWFGKNDRGQARASRREDNRSVIDKTHQQLADEVGITKKRRIEIHLKAFKEQGLLDYRTKGYGRGKTTRIWLLPEGVLRAYREGCSRLGEQDERHDKSGGS